MRGPNQPQNNDDGQQPTPPRSRGILGWLVFFGLALVAVLVVHHLMSRAPQRPIPVLDRLVAEPDAVHHISIKGNTVHVVLKELYAKNEYGGVDRFDVAIPPRNVPERSKQFSKVFGDRYANTVDPTASSQHSYAPDDGLLWHTLLTMVPWIIIILAIWYLVSRQMRSAGGPGGVLDFGRSRAKLAKKERVKVTFDDVAGIEEAKEEVKEIIEFLRNPQKFQRIGGRIPRGVMLIGPPGTGKTLLARAIAGEADVPFFSISGSDFVEMFVGVGASRVRDLFRQAKASSPCIIFLDEIDAVGRRRGSGGHTGGHDEREQTLNAILVEMDGFEPNEQVIVIGSTNRPDVLDPALRRPGRFDREIMIHLPDLNEREAILKVHADDVHLDEDVNLAVVARGTPGFSGADLAAIINEAAIRAVMHDRSAVTQEDLEESRDKVRWGRQKRSRVLDEEDRRLSAYHEAGHVLVSLLLHPDVEPLHKVSIIPRGMSLGATMFLPEKDRYTVRRRQILGQIKVSFAGRITEEILFDDISSGAADDIRQATVLARRMVCDWGMSDRIGPVRYSPDEQQTAWGVEYAPPKEHSDDTARRIDEEIQRILRECYDDAKDLLENNHEALSSIGSALLEHEVMSADEVRATIANIEVYGLDRPSTGEAETPAEPTEETLDASEIDIEREET